MPPTIADSRRSRSRRLAAFAAVLVAAAIPAAAFSARPQEPAGETPYTTEELRFTNAGARAVVLRDGDGSGVEPIVERTAAEDGVAGIELVGTLAVPDASTFGAGPFPAVVLVTGSGPQDRDSSLLGHRPFLVVADRLARRGLAVFRYDERGVGASGGSFAGATSEDFAGDAAAALDALGNHPAVDADRLGVFGHSEGALIAGLLAAAGSVDASAVVLVGGAAVPGGEVLVEQAAAIFESAGVLEGAALERSKRARRRMFELVAQGADEEKLGEALRAVTLIEAVSAGGAPPPGAAMMLTESLGVGQLASPWMRRFVALDPAPVFERAGCAVYAVFGELDVQVSPGQNAGPMATALARAPTPDWTVRVAPGLNHLMQPARTGQVAEYARIETTFDEALLSDIGAWLADRLGAGASRGSEDEGVE